MTSPGSRRSLGGVARARRVRGDRAHSGWFDRRPYRRGEDTVFVGAGRARQEPLPVGHEVARRERHIRLRQLSRSSPVRPDRPDVVEPGGTAALANAISRRVGRPGRLEVVDPVPRQAPRSPVPSAWTTQISLVGSSRPSRGRPRRRSASSRRPRGVPRDREAAARHLRPAAAVRPHLPDVPVSHVRDPFPVGRPVGRGLARPALVSLPSRVAVAVHHVQLGLAAPAAREDDALPAGRPRETAFVRGGPEAPTFEPSASIT